MKNIHTTSWPLFYFRWKFPFVLCTWCQQNFAHDQQKLSLPSQQIFNDRAQKCSRNPFLEDSFSPLVGNEEGVVIFPLLGQERSARVSSVAGAKGHPHTSPLTAGLSTCSCFSSPVSCLARTNHLTLDKRNSCLAHDSGPKWPLKFCHLCWKNFLCIG